MENTPANTTEKKSKGPRFVRWAVMLGIIVALNILFLVGRALIMPMPQYQDFCPTPTATSTPQDPHACATAGGIWTDLSDPTVATPKTAPIAATGYCDLTTKCQAEYQPAYDKYQLYSFIIEVGLGVLAIIAGVLPIGSSIVSSGLSYGGVVSLIIASAQYWTDAGDWLRLAIAVIALGALIYIGLKRFRD